jgi:uncharacterized cofD-like protein
VRVVGLGGGHGLATTLEAALHYASDIAAVVTVADDGGSSGRLTRELGVLPPGDIRNCLVALSDDTELSELFQHRFTSGALTGHTVGNLVIAALTERTGDFATAVEEAGRLLHVRGRVYPATTERVDLRARVEGGVVKGQVAVAQSRAPIQAVYLKPPEPAAFAPAVDAIMGADQVVLGPGSLFTSLIATLLVPGIAKALRDTDACRVFVCNSRMQKGETEGLPASAHVEALLAHVGPYSVDTIVVQSPVRAGDGVAVDSDALGFLNIDVVEADVALPDGGHVPERLADVLATLH